jgi:hypothetical protein
MADAALLTHPKNRRYVDAMRAAAPKLQLQYGIKTLDIGFDSKLEVRRDLNGRDDGPLFVLFLPDRYVTLKLIGPGDAPPRQPSIMQRIADYFSKVP